MGGAAHSVERSGGALEQEPRPARRANPQFSGCGFGETGSGAHVSLRDAASWDRATLDLSFRADRHGVEHAAVAGQVGPAQPTMRCVGDLKKKQIPRLRRPTFASRMKERIGLLRSE